MKSIKNIPKSIKIGILIGIPPFNRSGVVFSVTDLHASTCAYRQGHNRERWLRQESNLQGPFGRAVRQWLDSSGGGGLRLVRSHALEDLLY